jgi:hypothetical protein
MVNRKPAASRSLQGEARDKRAKHGSLVANKVSKVRVIRYGKAAAAFVEWLDQFGCRNATSWDELDIQAACWLETLWADGGQKTLAADSLSAIQHFLGSKRRLQGSWALLATWHRLEPAVQAPPLPKVLLFALCDLAREQNLPELVGYLLISFHCYLRPLELLQVRGTDIWIDRSSSSATVTLMQTKTSRSRGPETITLEDPAVIYWLRRLAPKSKELLLNVQPPHLRKWFMESLCRMGVKERFLLYSLRRGGATADFLQHHDAARCLLRGRWKDIRTFSLYLRAPEALKLAESYRAAAEVEQRAKRFQLQPYW